MMAVKRDRSGRVIAGGEPLELPQKTVQPVSQAVTQPAQSAGLLSSTPSRLTAAQINSLPLGFDVRNALMQQLGGYGAATAGRQADWMAPSTGGNYEDGSAMSNPNNTFNTDAVGKLKDYTFNWTPGPKESGVLEAYDSNGNKVAKWDQTPEKSVIGGLLEWGGLAGAGFGLAGLAGLGPLAAAGGAASGAASGSTSGTSSGLLSSVPAETLASVEAFAAANPVTAAQMAATIPSAGFAGLSSGLLAGVPAETLASIEAFTAANPVTASQIAATVPSGGLPGLSGGLLSSVPAESLKAIEAYTAANPVTAQTVAATMPQLPAVSSVAPAAFNAAADSQLASSQLGITGAQSAAAATAPATVNLGTLGGTMGTAGGLSGALAAGKQIATDALSPLTGFMKDNPLLGRLLTSGAVSLLSGAGGGSSSNAQAAAPVGPPVQWTSPLQQGLLAPVQQYAPPAITQNKPAGLLAQGFANDGAWRYLKG